MINILISILITITVNLGIKLLFEISNAYSYCRNGKWDAIRQEFLNRKNKEFEKINNCNMTSDSQGICDPTTGLKNNNENCSINNNREINPDPDPDYSHNHNSNSFTIKSINDLSNDYIIISQLSTQLSSQM